MILASLFITETKISISKIPKFILRKEMPRAETKPTNKDRLKENEGEYDYTLLR